MFSRFNETLTPDMQDEIQCIKNQVRLKQIPESFPDHMIHSMSGYSDRYTVIEQMGFALISNDWIKPLSKWIGNKKCLEVMAGSGALSFALKQQHVNIITTDNHSWTPQPWWKTDNMWTDVENIDAIEAVNKYGKDIDIIVMSWPYMDDTAYRTLKTMRVINPNCKIIFIGERSGGCTADDEFFKKSVEMDDEEFEEAISNFKKWRGIHDYPMLVK